MRGRRRTVWVGVGLVLLSAAPAFADAPPTGTGCTKTIEISAGGSNAWGVISEISATPIRICSVSFIASYAANGWAEVFESPITTSPTHAQATRKAEPGHPTQYGSESQFFGEQGRLTRFGVGAVVVKGQLLVHYQD